MNFTSPFSDLNKHKASIAGGKGASLGEMLNAGIPVPNGFVVLSDTFEHFLSETDLSQEIESILEHVDHKAIHTIDSASENIRNLILSKEIPEHIKSEILSSLNALNAEFVAVRSSATAEDGADHAWAGQLESYLNVTESNVLEKVQHCWSSLFTPRAIFYRFEKDLLR
jgi:pyruvate,water dikinase